MQSDAPCGRHAIPRDRTVDSVAVLVGYWGRESVVAVGGGNPATQPGTAPDPVHAPAGGNVRGDDCWRAYPQIPFLFPATRESHAADWRAQTRADTARGGFLEQCCPCAAAGRIACEAARGPAGGASFSGSE